MALSMSTGVALILAMAASIAAALAQQQPPSEDADVLRYPGRPSGTRPRTSIFPGFPGVRSPPSSSGFPSPRPPPPSTPSTSVIQPQPSPCPSPKAPLVQIPGFPGLPGSSTGGSQSPSSPADCVTPLAGLMTCGTFLTGSESETPAPQSECCTGLSTFLNSSSSAGDGDRTLRCLCPVILGDVNRMLPKPIDPVRMMYLPIACGVVLPPQAIYICFTGQSAPPVVGRIPEIWEKPSSSASSP